MKKVNENNLWVKFCKEIAHLKKALVLDVASGPGGGLVPCILYYNDEAYILMNDIEYRILLEWRRFLRGMNKGKYVGFLAADAKRLPIKNNSLDIVVSGGGFSNIPEHGEALHEAFRVLRPGGMLYMIEGGILREDFMKLPSHIRQGWLEHFPALLGEWDRMIKDIGFEILFYETKGIERLSPDEGDLPKIAYEYGVTLRFAGMYLKAAKPEGRPTPPDGGCH